MIMQKNISIENAVITLQSHTCLPDIGKISLSEAAGLILAEDIFARISLPPFHRSTYDGFALHWEETQHACEDHPVGFEISGMIAAGDFAAAPLEKGCAVRIMTGAALPEGADCVINFERVTEKGDKVYIHAPLTSWQNVDRMGAETAPGAMLFRRGECLTASHLGVLASQGIPEVSVFRKPKAVILSTGSELLEPGAEHVPGKIYNSNLYVFRALLEKENFQVIGCVHVQDDRDFIAETLLKYSQKADLIITTGGASVGDRDYALSALEKAGADILFAGALMKPGSCCCSAVLNGALILSLSGNPGAALTTYYRIALPAVRRMTGRRDCLLREAMMPLAQTCHKTCKNPRILKGHTEISDGVIRFAAHEGQLNGMQTSFLYMDSFAELPPTDKAIEAGSMVRVFFP